MQPTNLELSEVGDVGAAAHVVVDVADLNDSHGTCVALGEAPGARLDGTSYHSQETNRKILCEVSYIHTAAQTTV